MAGESSISTNYIGELTLNDWSNIPMSFNFTEEGIDDIIIERKNGKKIVIPFSELLDALEEDK